VDDAEEQRAIVAFLSQASTYGPGVKDVTRYETHGSIVFLAGRRAYKLKRAVRFPYMDYSTRALRHQMCLRELAVNRRTAPELYLDVLPIVRDEHGALQFGTNAEDRSAMDWVVVMRRFDQENLLEKVAETGGLTREMTAQLAQSIAEFHHAAEITPEFGGAARVREIIAENAAIFRAADGPFRSAMIDRYERESLGLLGKLAPVLDKRQRDGHVRRCHGDLHLNNIVMLANRPVLFDAIEFNDAFACIDVLYDLAFLLMDLDRHGARDHANTILNRYLEIANEHDGLAALPLFLSCLAAIRAHTAVAKAKAVGCSNSEDSQMANALLDAAVSYLDPVRPRLVAIGGVSGTGKSTVARRLAPLLGVTPGAIVIRSDVLRKQLLGVAQTVRLPSSAYAPEVTQNVYARMAELASAVLASGYSVIADAVHGNLMEQTAIEEVARIAGVRFDGIWLDAPAEILESRIRLRQGDASDATVDVLRAQRRSVVQPQRWIQVSASGSESENFENARRVLAD
jgi:hypothetical protein